MKQNIAGSEIKVVSKDGHFSPGSGRKK